MSLHIESDASYLVLPQSENRIAGYFFFKTNINTLNALIHIECNILLHVVSSAAEAEIGGVFVNSHFCLPLRAILKALNHPQPPTPVKTDNYIALGYVHNNIKLRCSKSWDICRYLLQDKKMHKIICVFWRSGKDKKDDYFTKR